MTTKDEKNIKIIHRKKGAPNIQEIIWYFRLKNIVFLWTWQDHCVTQTMKHPYFSLNELTATLFTNYKFIPSLSLASLQLKFIKKAILRWMKTKRNISKLMECSKSSVWRETYSYKCLHLKKISNQELSFTH